MACYGDSFTFFYFTEVKRSWRSAMTHNANITRRNDVELRENISRYLRFAAISRIANYTIIQDERLACAWVTFSKYFRYSYGCFFFNTSLNALRYSRGAEYRNMYQQIRNIITNSNQLLAHTHTSIRSSHCRVPLVPYVIPSSAFNRSTQQWHCNCRMPSSAVFRNVWKLHNNAVIFNKHNSHYDRFEVFTAVAMMNTVFWGTKTQYVPHMRHITSPLHSPASQCYLTFKVFTAVIMKNAFFWDIKTQSPPHRKHKAIKPSRLTLCKIWGLHGGDYEDYCLLGCNSYIASCSLILSTLMIEAIRSC
jgi:hypothetical protein